MNIFKRLAAYCFQRKQAAPRKEDEVSSQVQTEPSAEQCCKYVKLGQAEYPLFEPYPLMQFYSIYMAYKMRGASIVQISQIELLNLRDPRSKKLLATVWAVKTEDGYVWGEVGACDVNFSEFCAFSYEPTETLELPVKKLEKSTIVAECRYQNQKVAVIRLFEESDEGKERKQIKHFKLFCSLEKAAKYAEDRK